MRPGSINQKMESYCSVSHRHDVDRPGHLQTRYTRATGYTYNKLLRGQFFCGFDLFFISTSPNASMWLQPLQEQSIYNLVVLKVAEVSLGYLLLPVLGRAGVASRDEWAPVRHTWLGAQIYVMKFSAFFFKLRALCRAFSCVTPRSSA
jgi:hypothetical protein